MCAGWECIDTVWRDIDSDETAVNQMAQWWADCYHMVESGTNVLCGVIDAGFLEHTLEADEVKSWVCDTATAEDFLDGERDLEAAKGVAGCGLFNNEDLHWSEGIPAGSFWEFCMWVIPAEDSFDEQTVGVGRCENFVR